MNTTIDAAPPGQGGDATGSSQAAPAAMGDTWRASAPDGPELVQPARAWSHDALLGLEFWSLAPQDQPWSRQAQLGLLDQREKARLAGLRREQDGQRYLAAHAGLRQRLAQRLGVAADGLRFATDSLGKPVLSDHPDLYFNLSHSDDCAMLALASVPVGCDLERLIRPADLSDSLLRQILAPREMAGLRGLSVEEQADKLTLQWVRKEAVMKASGQGFRLPPTEVMVSAVSGKVEVSGEWRYRLQYEWICQQVAAPAGYRAALALALVPGVDYC